MMGDSHMTDGQRMRTVTWQDPMIGATAARTMSGIDYLRAMMSSTLPLPLISELFKMRFAEIAVGRVVFAVMPSEESYNPMGVVHGGFICTLLDSAMGCAGQSTLAAGLGYTSLDIHVHFVRAVTLAVGELRAIGETVHVGKRIITAQGRLVDANDKLYAHATTTCMVLGLEN